VFWTTIDLRDPASSHVADGVTRHATHQAAIDAGADFLARDVAGWESERHFGRVRDYVATLPPLPSRA
jgi:hypothetical protein